MAVRPRPESDQVAALINSSIVLAQAGDLEEAERRCRRVLELRPDHPGALSSLGSIAALGGRRSEALEWFRRALEQEPERAGTHDSIAQVLAADPPVRGGDPALPHRGGEGAVPRGLPAGPRRRAGLRRRLRERLGRRPRRAPPRRRTPGELPGNAPPGDARPRPPLAEPVPSRSAGLPPAGGQDGRSAGKRPTCGGRSGAGRGFGCRRRRARVPPVIPSVRQFEFPETRESRRRTPSL